MFTGSLIPSFFLPLFQFQWVLPAPLSWYRRKEMTAGQKQESDSIGSDPLYLKESSILLFHDLLSEHYVFVNSLNEEEANLCIIYCHNV